MHQPHPSANAHTALHEGERSLRQILDNTTAVVYVKDRQGRNLLVNKQFERLFGLREADVVGRTDAEIFGPQAAAALRANDGRVFEALAPIEFEEVVPQSDGEHTYLSLKFPLFNADGEAYAVCGMSTDITERKRVEQALRNVALGVSAASGGDVFQAIVRYLAESLGVDFAFVGQLVDSGRDRLKTLAVYHAGRIVSNIEYDLAGTPCQSVVGREFRFIPQGVGDLYPGDNMLHKFGFQGYAGYPLFDTAGRPLGLIAVTNCQPLTERGITESMLKIFSVRAAAELERLRAEEARRISEASYRSIFEASEDAIFIHDIDSGAIVDVNPKACRAYGYDYQEMLGASIGDLSSGEHPYTQDEAMRLIRQVQYGEPVCTEWHRRNKDGSLHWDEVHLKRTMIGGVERLMVFTREITERKAREDALRKSEDRLRATIEAAIDCIIGMDAAGNIVEFNPAAERCFGYQRGAVLGKPLADLLIPERKRTAHRAGLARFQTLRKGPFLGRRVEVQGMRADGSEFPAELAITVAQGPEGDIFIGYLRDIAERKQAESARVLLEAQLRQAQKMEAIGHLSGGIAHDFNNILTGIMGYIVLAQEWARSQGDAKLNRYLDCAQQSGQRARDLIRQMLTFSRGQRGEPQALALAPLVKESVKLLGSTLPASTELDTDLDGGLAPVMVDPVHVEQILMNLCINARDAMNGVGHIGVGLHQVHHDEAVCASCRQPVSGEFIELSVCDTGPGIPTEHLDRIFEPFYTTKGVGKGSGMGLSTVHGIVHEYGAHILVDTAAGEGATFRVLFTPLAAPAAGVSTTITPGAEVQSHNARLRGRVLVVDDDETVGDFMDDLFVNWGLQVTLARNGEEGRDVFAANPRAFDFAVFDQTMPRMSGLELTRCVLSQRPDLPVILYTGYSEHINEAKARAAGVRALLRKPVDTDRLFNLVRDFLGSNVR